MAIPERPRNNPVTSFYANEAIMALVDRGKYRIAPNIHLPPVQGKRLDCWV